MTQEVAELPECFRLDAWGAIAKDHQVQQLFKRRFLIAWNRLPQVAKDVIRRRCDDTVIELHDENHKMTKGSSGNASAQCSAYARIGETLIGPELRYITGIARNLPEESCVFWISHELAHLYLFATDPDHGKDSDLAERQVDGLLLGDWGFSEKCKTISEVHVDVIRIKNANELPDRLRASQK